MPIKLLFWNCVSLKKNETSVFRLSVEAIILYIGSITREGIVGKFFLMKLKQCLTEQCVSYDSELASCGFLYKKVENVI